MEKINFQAITTRSKITSRGGGIEVDLSGLGWPGVRMTAYQNYLGGGLLGRVENDCMISDWRTEKRLVEIAEQLREYFHNLTNPDTEWESRTYEENQNMSLSAY